MKIIVYDKVTGAIHSVRGATGTLFSEGTATREVVKQRIVTKTRDIPAVRNIAAEGQEPLWEQYVAQEQYDDVEHYKAQEQYAISVPRQIETAADVLEQAFGLSPPANLAALAVDEDFQLPDGKIIDITTAQVADDPSYAKPAPAPEVSLADKIKALSQAEWEALLVQAGKVLP